MESNKGLMLLAGVGVAGAVLWYTMGSASAAGNCGAPAVDPTGRKSTRSGDDCARAGIASNPDFQWLYMVKEGDNPALITKRYLGTDNREPIDPSSSAQTAYVELIDANPDQGVNEGNRNNPWSTGYNFARLMPGDTLKIPRAWNAYIDEQGNPRGKLAPFPVG